MELSAGSFQQNGDDNSETDTRHLGDGFGCKIETKRSIRKGNYHWHYLKDVQKNGVADQMKLQSGDQLVLLNRQFMPEFAYKQVTELLSGVPVDSKTRFSLTVLRRTQDKNWEWISTSAILCADYETDILYGSVIAKDRQCKANIGCQFDNIGVYRLNVKGTDMYLKIDGRQVLLEVAKSANKDKYNICVWTKCYLDELTGFTSYIACLYGDDHKQVTDDSEEMLLGSMKSIQYGYITVTGDRDVTITNTLHWFGYRQNGRGQAFEVSKLLAWIACEIYDFGTSGKICLKPWEFFFDSYFVGSHEVNTLKRHEMAYVNDTLKSCW